MLLWNQEHPEEMRKNLALGPQAAKRNCLKKLDTLKQE